MRLELPLYVPVFTAMKDVYYNSISQDCFSTRSHKNELDPLVLLLSATTPYNNEPASSLEDATSTMLQYKKEVALENHPKEAH